MCEGVYSVHAFTIDENCGAVNVFISLRSKGYKKNRPGVAKPKGRFGASFTREKFLPDEYTVASGRKANSLWPAKLLTS